MAKLTTLNGSIKGNVSDIDLKINRNKQNANYNKYFNRYYNPSHSYFTNGIESLLEDIDTELREADKLPE